MVKTVGGRERVSPFSVENFFSHRVQKNRGGILQCFRETREWKSFLHKKGISRCSVWSFLFQYQKNGRLIFICFRKNRISRVLCVRSGQAGHRVFLSINCQKTHEGTHQSFRKDRRSKEIMQKKRISPFSVENFLTHRPKKHRGRHFNVSKKFHYQKISRVRGDITIFRWSFSSHSTEKKRRGTYLGLRKFRVSKKFMHRRGISRCSVRSCLFQYQKLL